MDSIEELATVFKALSDPTRLRLLKLLNNNLSPDECPVEACGGQRFLCVNAMAKRLGVTQSAVSQHLRVLRHAGLVNGTRRGSFMHYALDRAGIQKHNALLQEMLSVSFAVHE
jgi:DNA-binding transcriptional ArsR family regulator